MKYWMLLPLLVLAACGSREHDAMACVRAHDVVVPASLWGDGDTHTLMVCDEYHQALTDRNR